MEFQVDQLSLVVSITTALADQAKERGIELMVDERRFNTIIDAANLIVESYAKPLTKASAGMGLTAWLMSDDTGVSSKTMAAVLCGVPYALNRRHHPSDPDDFGRCHRFLEAVPEARAKLVEMKRASSVWSNLVDSWDELTALYLEELPSGKAPRLYARMKELGC